MKNRPQKGASIKDFSKQASEFSWKPCLPIAVFLLKQSHKFKKFPEQSLMQLHFQNLEPAVKTTGRQTVATETTDIPIYDLNWSQSNS